jgi:hypothetical protein
LDCLTGQQKRNVPAPDLNIRELHPLSCQVEVWDWCGPQHVRALHGELYWFLAVCPRGYHWGAISAKKSDFVSIVNSLLRHIRGKVGDDRVRFVKFDGGAEFRTESAVQVYCEWKLDFSVNCPNIIGRQVLLNAVIPFIRTVCAQLVLFLTLLPFYGDKIISCPLKFTISSFMLVLLYVPILI